MRSESDSASKENSGRRTEGQAAPVEKSTWELIDMNEQQDGAKRLMDNLFGEVLSKLQYLVSKDKKNLEKILKGKKHGN